MYVIPAVDIMGGKVVRLLRGDPRMAKHYESLGDPVTLAKKWESEGTPMIHVVDLDAALGEGENTKIVDKIVKSINVPIQVGGGIRSIDRASQLLNMDVERIVLGSLAFKDAESLKTLLKDFGWERIVVALDHVDGNIMIDGWRTSAHITIEEAAQKFSGLGVKFFLATDIQRDGTISGPNLKCLSKILSLGVNVMASGGVRSLDDIVALKRAGVYGVIIGRALYEGLFSLREALKILGQ